GAPRARLVPYPTLFRSWPSWAPAPQPGPPAPTTPNLQRGPGAAVPPTTPHAPPTTTPQPLVLWAWRGRGPQELSRGTPGLSPPRDRKSTRLNSSHVKLS